MNTFKSSKQPFVDLLKPAKIKQEMCALAEMQGVFAADKIFPLDHQAGAWMVFQLQVSQLVRGFQSLTVRKRYWRA